MSRLLQIGFKPRHHPLSLYTISNLIVQLIFHYFHKLKKTSIKCVDIFLFIKQTKVTIFHSSSLKFNIMRIDENSYNQYITQACNKMIADRKTAIKILNLLKDQGGLNSEKIKANEKINSKAIINEKESIDEFV